MATPVNPGSTFPVCYSRRKVIWDTGKGRALCDSSRGLVKKGGPGKIEKERDQTPRRKNAEKIAGGDVSLIRTHRTSLRKAC